MKKFLKSCGEKIIGVLSGFDRVVLRGTLRQLAHVAGMYSYLSYKNILLKDFNAHFQKITEALKAASLKRAEELGRPVRYVASSRVSKEDLARDILKVDPVESGLICVLSSVEPCRSFNLHRDREKKKLVLEVIPRKCLHLYHYFLDPQFGFMSARVQTWLPFNVQICLNGREWLAKQLDAAGIGYERRDNTFVWIEEVEGAQRLLEAQLRINWPKALERIRRLIHPAHSKIFAGDSLSYYWSVYQAEWATDLMFDSAASLAAIYPSLVLHAITQFSSPDVMRFLGRKPHPNFQGEIVSDFKNRPEGMRVKHRVNGNSVKMYDKQGSILRVETTINQPRDLKVYRPKEGEPEGEKSWRPLRKGIADLHRLAKVSQDSNQRYLEALATVEENTKVSELVEEVCRPITLKGRRVRALRPWESPDAELLEAVNHGEFVLNGFRNRDIQALLYGTSKPPDEEKRRRTARVGRLLRMLRAHKLIKKVPQTHRYQLSEKGRQVIGALLAARNASVSSLLKAA